MSDFTVEFKERLWLLWFYLRHPMDWLCDNGYRECPQHKKVRFYEYLRSVISDDDLSDEEYWTGPPWARWDERLSREDESSDDGGKSPGQKDEK